MDKILVIQTAFIGDAVLTLPMLQELRKMNPDCRIEVIAIPSTEKIFSHSPAVDEVIILDKRGKHKPFFSFLEFTRQVKARGYTRIYSPHRSFRTAFIVWLTGVRETYGFTENNMRHLYRYLVEYNPDDHEVKRNLNLAGADTSGENWRIKPVIKIPQDVKDNIAEYVADNKLNGSIAIAPGSIWKTKVYPQEYFSEVISWLSRNNYKVILIGSDKEEAVCSELAGSGNALSAAGRFNLIEVVELLKHTRLLITNDSSPAHLGQAADIPVLTIYCSTNASIGFYPYNSVSSYLSYDNLFCKPCGIHGRTECPIKTFECGYNLKPSSIISRIEEILNDKVY